MKPLVKMIADLSIQYGDYKYNEYLTSKDLKFIPEHKIKSVIDTMYDKNNKEQYKEFIRTALKEIMKDKYTPIPVEEILLEIDENDLSIKERIYTEITLKQSLKKSP